LLVRPKTGDLAAAGPGLTTRAVKRRLAQIQYRPGLADAVLTLTGLVPDGSGIPCRHVHLDR
jgi:hypothetical protein